MRRYPSAGVAVADVLLPRPGIDFAKWAVVACDQYTSEPDYWRQVEETVGEAPSTLRLVYPEVYLGERDPQTRIGAIRRAMSGYLEQGVLTERAGLVYVERRVEGRTRRGIVLAVDLEQYDYNRGSSSLVRATEGTILDRLPPRVRIRRGASLELPHIMVLVDDPEDTVVGQLTARKNSLTPLYDFDLMMDSGHVSGFLVQHRQLEAEVMNALVRLRDPDAFKRKYGFEDDRAVLLYAMGDGNHSLATAKAIWEKTKEGLGSEAAIMASPARYALVELVNLHDDALVFEPIHRLVFDVADGRNPIDEMGRFYEGRFEVTPVDSLARMRDQVDEAVAGTHRIGIVHSEGFAVLHVHRPDSQLAVGTLQAFLDGFLRDGGAASLDYVHGTSTVVSLGRKRGNMGYYLPAMSKHDLFRTVIADGALPRKTFSMGEAYEKRFYVECRRLG